MLKKRSLPEPVEDEIMSSKQKNMGNSILKSMGWNKGDKVGKNPMSYLEKPLELKPRPKGLGLGATPKEQLLNEMAQKTKEKINSKLDQWKIGDEVQITKKKHKGLSGKIVKIINKSESNRNKESLKKNIDLLEISQKSGIENDSDFLKIWVRINDEIVLELTENEIKNPPTKKEILENKRQKKLKRIKREENQNEKFTWLLEGLKVRIRSKKLKNGAFFGKKGSIQFIDSKGRAQILLKNGAEIKKVKAKHLETVVGPVKSKVKVVKGKFKGHIAFVFQKFKGQSKVLINLQNQINSVKEVDLADICQFV